MRSLTTLTVATSLLACATAHATPVLSACVTVTGVVNAEYGNAVIVLFSPTIAGCTYNDSTGGVVWAAGTNGVTSTSLGSYLATGLTALSLGRQVQVLYDNSTSSCFGYQMAIGGDNGQC